MSTGMKAMLFIALAAICVFLGVEIASTGTQRVQGPLPSAALPTAPSAAATEAPTGAAEADASPAAATPPADTGDGLAAAAAAFPSDGRASLINRISVGLGDALRYLAKGLIRFVADAFEAILD